MNSFPILYKRGANGDILFWEIYVDGDTFYTRSGIYDYRDKRNWYSHVRESQYSEDHGSHKPAEDVAYEHAHSKWSIKKRNECMVEDPSDLEDNMYPVPIVPVLARDYDELLKMHKNPRSKYKFPSDKVYVFPKYDGNRCTATQKEDGNIGLYSRARRELPNLPHIRDAIYTLFERLRSKYPSIFVDGVCGIHLDGELFMPNSTRNKMRSSISKLEEDKHNQDTTYIIFDVVTQTDMPFRNRYRILRNIFKEVDGRYIREVPLLGMAELGTSDIRWYLGKAQKQGYEGIVMRTPTMLYPNRKHRSYEMIKCKEYKDQEYIIEGAHEGKDGHKGLIVWELKDPHEDIHFHVTPSWSHDERLRAWNDFCADPQSYIGRYMNVVFRDKTEYGVPVEAVGTYIRDPADM